MIQIFANFKGYEGKRKRGEINKNVVIWINDFLFLFLMKLTDSIILLSSGKLYRIIMIEYSSH